MLPEIGTLYPEPGWVEVPYSPSSQITHSIPIGHLYTVASTMAHGMATRSAQSCSASHSTRNVRVNNGT